MSEVTTNIFPLEWKLSDPLVVPYHGMKVFGTFICGGGSTMGYKLAGYNHLGGVEFVENYAKIYKKNHKPRWLYLEDIRQFNLRDDLPDELFDLDVLDGSPPCAAFSTAGAREKLWGKESEYEDKVQVKDDLPFVYCNTILKLKPKVFLLENVSGLAKGNALVYLKKIVDTLSSEYNIQVFLLYASSMGIPQIRNRVFVIGLRKDIIKPELCLNFNCKQTNFSITEKYWDHPDNHKYNIEKFSIGKLWHEVLIGRNHKKRFSLAKNHPNKPSYTILATNAVLAAAGICHPYQIRKLNVEEVRLLCTFPKDYDFLDHDPINVMGRSVLPVMMANISYQIYLQWLKV